MHSSSFIAASTHSSIELVLPSVFLELEDKPLLGITWMPSGSVRAGPIAAGLVGARVGCRIRNGVGCLKGALVSMQASSHLPEMQASS